MKWNPKLIQEFVTIFGRIVDMNFGTNRLYAVMGKFISERIDDFKIYAAKSGDFVGFNNQLWKAIDKIAVSGIVHGDTITTLEEEILTPEVAKMFNTDQFWIAGMDLEEGQE